LFGLLFSSKRTDRVNGKLIEEGARRIEREERVIEAFGTSEVRKTNLKLFIEGVS